MFELIKRKIKNRDILWLTEKIIFWDCTTSFILRDKEAVIKRIPPNKSIFGKDNKKGLAIGNLTSQFFANVYLNELDQFIKHILKVKYYIRYVDDFILLSDKKEKLANWIEKIEDFLKVRLSLKLHPRRRKLRSVSNGVDFLGYLVRRNYILARKRVINNMKAKLRHFARLITSCSKAKKLNPIAVWEDLRSSIQSYLGHLGWANSYNLVKKLTTNKVISPYFEIRNYRLVPKY